MGNWKMLLKEVGGGGQRDRMVRGGNNMRELKV